MNDASFILTPARYLVQIASEGEWKTVAYLNDIEEAWRTMENVPDLRVFDTWKNAGVRLRDRPRVSPRSTFGRAPGKADFEKSRVSSDIRGAHDIVGEGPAAAPA